MQKVEFKAKVARSFEEIINHVVSAYNRGLPHFTPTEQIHQNHAVLCGSGPTITEHVEEIRAHKERKHCVVSLNASHDYLISHDIIPDVHVSVDPRPRIIKGFRQIRDDIIYLIATQCHPGVFEHLKGKRVYLWNSYSAELHEFAEKNRWGRKFGMVHGGTTAGLRGIVLLYLMGYRYFHLYGMDCSFEKERNIDGTMPKNHEYIKINGRTFLTDRQMMAQAMEMGKVAQQTPGAKYKCYGDTLMASIIEEGRAYGREEFFLPSEDFHRVRPKAALSLHGSGPLIDDKFVASSADLPAYIGTAPDLEKGSDGVHLY